jgi:hypothetical protein
MSAELTLLSWTDLGLIDYGSADGHKRQKLTK